MNETLSSYRAAKINNIDSQSPKIPAIIDFINVNSKSLQEKVYRFDSAIERTLQIIQRINSEGFSNTSLRIKADVQLGGIPPVEKSNNSGLVKELELINQSVVDIDERLSNRLDQLIDLLDYIDTQI